MSALILDARKQVRVPLGRACYARLIPMTDDQIELLKRSSGKIVELFCTDGEVVQAQVISVSETEKDVVYDLISSNMDDRYRNRKANEAYLTPFEQIDSIRLRTE